MRHGSALQAKYIQSQVAPCLNCLSALDSYAGQVMHGLQ